MQHYFPENKSLSTNQDAKNQAAWLIYLILHLPLAYLMDQFSIVATAHAWLTLIIGLYFLAHDKKPNRLIYLCGYIVGAEVLWRMTSAGVFWEFGKIILSALLALGILRWGNGKIRLLSLVYIVPLLISSVNTFDSLSVNEARQQISFNLFGHLLLAISLAFFSTQKLKPDEFQKVLTSLVIPIVSIAFLILLSIERADFIEFTDESNFITSGGYGPNQVSAILGLGALACWLLVLLLPVFNFERLLVLGLCAGLLLQAVFTFSRGGVFNVLIAAPFATLWLLRNESRAIRLVFIGAIVISSIFYILLPQLNIFTGGALEARYQELDTTGRAEIVRLDINIWLDHFFLGVGPGMSSYFRAPFLGKLVAPHTEYSRLLAEHGLAGIWAMVLMGGMSLHIFTKAHEPWARGLAVALILWSLAEMTHSAMRISAISFIFTLPLAVLEIED